jgi:hypothetical protein
MLLTALLPLLPLALAVPTTPELSVSQWKDVQSNFLDSVRSYGLGSWSWNKAEEVMGELDIKNPFAGDESELTLWQQLKADPHSFSKLVKLIEVGVLWLDLDVMLTRSVCRDSDQVSR